MDVSRRARGVATANGPDGQARPPLELTDDERAFLVAEYEHVTESIMRNEESGEKRAAFLLTLTSGVFGVLALVLKRDGQSLTLSTFAESGRLVAAGLAVPLGFGLLTLRRLVKRNISTDRYKLGLRALRRHVVSPDAAAHMANAFFGLYAPFDAEGGMKRSYSYLPLKGSGWLETVALVNALLAGAILGLVVPTQPWLRPDVPNDAGAATLAVVAGAVGASFAWVVQISLATASYERNLRGPTGRDAEDLESHRRAEQPLRPS